MYLPSHKLLDSCTHIVPNPNGKVISERSTMGLIGLTGILLLIILALFVVMIYFVIDGIKTKNWKKTIISIAIFFSVVLLMYYTLLGFIASM